MEQPTLSYKTPFGRKQPITFRGAIWCVIFWHAMDSWSWWYLIPLVLVLPIWVDLYRWVQQQNDWKQHKKWEDAQIAKSKEDA